MSFKKWLISIARPLIDRFPRIATMYRSLRDQINFIDEPSMTPWGFKLSGNKSMAKGDFELTETELVRDILKDVDVLVNVGANVGYYCCHALSLGKQVIAFEPIQRNIRYLLRNIKSNGWTGAEVFPLALSERVGVLEIYGGDTGASLVKGWAGIPEGYVTYVPSSTMDVVLGKRLKGKRTFILVDVEGAEKWVLEGAALMLCNDPKPVWLVEITAKEHQPSGVGMNPNFASTFRIFFQNGYQAFVVDKKISPVTMEDVDLVSSGNLKLNSHNFLFRAPA